ncbi:acyloxyacyl hydrolase [Chlorobaculum sp. MV4-Y]|uniref:acyloxyacyl hydrolase n=1 Tax=Chlorobaculum sp. MV4-Y TaxID=2976335 RepID=UPI0021B04627|nr:acyloxyacyl hydrolase [Chlorobaculum sp. MV4-Y]UWX57622.1 acyloxyacyl hydrolase [Chlorobaculum sp. MV4-Y]
MQKKLFRLFISLLLACSFIPVKLDAAPADTHDGVYLDEIAIGSGYAWGHLKFTHADFNAVPIFVRFGFNMNSVFGMRDSKGTLQLALEPFCNPVTEPESGVETGLNVFFRYLHPIAPSVKLVGEIGSGPMYLSIDSREQGDAGFNFLNQFGLGAQVAVSENSAITLGYRFRHLSNAGTSEPNRGINSNAVVLSYSLLY